MGKIICATDSAVILKQEMLAEKTQPILLVFVGKQMKYFKSSMLDLDSIEVLSVFCLTICGYSESFQNSSPKYTSLTTGKIQ